MSILTTIKASSSVKFVFILVDLYLPFETSLPKQTALTEI